MRVTLKQIAEIANVHRSTVDKVLHNRVGVSPEVRTKVQNIIDMLGYEPNTVGRALQRHGENIRLACILLKVSALPDLRHGIETAVHHYRDYNMEMEYYAIDCTDAEEEAAVIERQIAKKIDGLIVWGINDRRVRDSINRAVQAGIPVVTTNMNVDGAKNLCFVGQNLEQAGRVAGRLMGEFLNDHGKVAVITSAESIFTIADRVRGFKNVLQSSYQGIRIVDTIEIMEDPLKAFQLTMELLKKFPDLDGVFLTCGCVTDVARAIRIMAPQRKIRYIVFEKYPEIVRLLKEGIVTCAIDSDIYMQGYQPVKILFDYIMFDRSPKKTFYQTKLDVIVPENVNVGEGWR